MMLTEAEMIAKVKADPEAAYHVLIAQDTEIERLRAENRKLRVVLRANAIRWNPSRSQSEIDSEIERIITK